MGAMGSTKKLDIALAHPWSKDTIKGAAKEGGYVAAKREVKKITKYNSELLHGGSKPHMIPLVFEHFGHWGSEGEKFRHYIAKLSRNDQGKKDEADFCRY